MTTADEIRQRVEQADRDRMAARQNAAAEVAEHVDKRKALREQLDEADRDLAQTVSAAEQVMTRRELAAFLDAKPGEVDEWATAGSSRSSRRRGSGSASGKRSSRTRSASSRAASDAPPSTDDSTTTASSTGEAQATGNAAAESTETSAPTSP